MSKEIRDVVAVTGTYEKGGETKKIFTKVGVAFIDEKGTSIKLEKWFNPAGVIGDCWLSLYEQKSNTNKSSPSLASDDVPF